jgi:hypothetical protein
MEGLSPHLELSLICSRKTVVHFIRYLAEGAISIGLKFSSTQDHIVYKQFNGVVSDVEEGQNIAKAMGSKKVRTFVFQLT